MKKYSAKILVSVLMIIFLLALVACNNQIETEDLKRLVMGEFENIDDINAIGTPMAGTVEAYAKYTLDSIDLTFLSKANTKKNTYGAYSDEKCTKSISEIVLQEGENIFYVLGKTKKQSCKIKVKVIKDETPHITHEYGEWNIVKAATCTQKGMKEKVCSICGSIYDEEIDAIGHDYDYDNIQWDWSAQVVKASVLCKNDNSHEKTLNALIISDIYDYVQTDKATVEIDGKTYEDTKSERVDYTIQWIWNTNAFPVTATARVITSQGATDYPAEVKSDAAEIWSCTTSGKVVHTATFKYNNSTYTNVKIVVGEAMGHSYGDWIVEKQASCTEEGARYRICANDSTHIDREKIDKKAHSYGKWIVIKEATETEDGWRERICTACSHPEKEPIHYQEDIETEYAIEYRSLFEATHTNPTVYTASSDTIILKNPTERDGYSFIGWYDSEKGGNRVTSIAKGSTEDKVLYAHWDFRIYTVTYENTYGAIANPASYTMNDEIIFLDPAQRNGYFFKGWLDEQNKTATGIERGSTGNRTFVADWGIYTYTITYENTQGAENPNPTEYDVEAAEINLIALSRDGYDFDGWYDEEENGNKIVAISHGSYENIILYARFTPKTFTVVASNGGEICFTVSFDGNGTDIDTESQTITASDTLTYPDIPTRSGYIFAGWYDNRECSGDPFDFSADIRSNIILYAKWIGNSGNTIKMNENKSVYINGTTQVYYYFVPLVSGSITTYSTGSLDTYGYLYQNGTQLTSNDDGGVGSNFQITYNVTAGLLYAVSVKGYSTSTNGTVVLSLTGTEKPSAGGKADIPVFTVTYGQSYDFGAGETKPGYKFVGYYTEANGEGTKLTDEEGKSLDVWTYLEDMAVYVSYQPTKYKVTFDTQGGSIVQSAEFYYGENVVIPDKPTLEGKSFVGWFLSISDEQAYVPSAMPAEDFVLYAKWINYSLNDFAYNEGRNAIKITDEITAELFEAVLTDTDGEEVEISASIVEGEQVAGTEISVRLLAQGKYNKRKSVTIDNIKVYSLPTLVFDDTRDYINLAEELNGEPFNASGIDTFGEATVITAEIDGEYQGGDTVSVILKSIDPVGNVTSATVTNVKVYDKPTVTYNGIEAATESDNIDLAFFEASAADSFGIACEVNFEKEGEQTVGETVTVKLTSEDEKGNAREITIEVRIYGAPTVNNVQKVNFKVSDEITPETLGVSATDTHGGAVENITLTLKSGVKEPGHIQTYTVKAIDLVGNEASRDFSVKIFDAPTFVGTKTAIKDTDDADDNSIYGITAKDSFGRILDFTATVEGEQTAGGLLSVVFSVIDDAGNEATLTKSYDVLSADGIVIVYNQGQSNVIKITSRGEEFSASATDTKGMPCQISVVGVTGELEAGKVTNIVLRATDAAGNTKDSAVIENISVYSIPSAIYKKHNQWYLTAADQKTNLFRIVDSFGEELYSEETKIFETETEYAVRVVADLDEAGNAFDEILTLVKIQAGSSLIELFVSGERIGNQTVISGLSYTLPCPEGYRYTWKINGEAITDNEGNSLNAWDRADGGYTAEAELEIIDYTITYFLNGGVNSSNNPAAFTVKALDLPLSAPSKATVKEVLLSENLGNGMYRRTVRQTAYSFLGWYTDSDWTNTISAISSLGNITVYARWSENTTTTTTVSAYLREGNYLYFGTYPQTLVRDSDLSSALGSYSSNTWTSYGYYKNGSVSDYMYYCDKEYNGEKYRGVYFTEKRPYCTTDTSAGSTPHYWAYDIVSRSNYKTYETSTVYWFKYEPIKWKIVKEKNGLATIVADLILDSQSYYISDTLSSTTRTDYQGNTASAYSNNYQYSTIRTWLNVTFYETAFNDLQKEIIQATNVDNSASSTGYSSNDYACDNTNDKIFLLSYEEVSTYFTSNGARMKQSTDYAKSQGLYTRTDSGADFGTGEWWLRSPDYDDSYCASYVYYVGLFGFSRVYYTNEGVVPALVIKLS